MNVPFCNTHADMLDIGGYCHLKPLKNGTYSMYEGCYSGRTSCTVGQLEAVRIDGKVLRFNSVDDAEAWVNR